jgi:hypothetical protein
MDPRPLTHLREEKQMTTTTTSLPRRVLLCLLVVATLTTAAYAATASAAATPSRFYMQFPTQTGPNPDPQPCTGLLGGTATNTVTVQGHRVDNADGTLHIFEYVTQNIREDWTDGTYLITQIVGPQDFNINATGTSSFSGTQQGPGTLYSPTGQILAYVTINTEFHGTFVNGVPTVLTSQFIIVRNTCT